MAFDPSGLPILPTCESDIARWAGDLQTWLISKMTTAHNEIDGISIDPFDICTQLGNLAGPSCLVPSSGIDTSGFTFAPTISTPLTPGVLPWPGQVMSSGIPMTNVRQGIVDEVVTSSSQDFPVNFTSVLPTSNFALIIEPNSNPRGLFWKVGSRSTSGFVIGAMVEVGTPDVRCTWVYTAIALG